MNHLPIIQEGVLYVVETEENQYLGTIEDMNDYIVIRSGLSGRPSVVAYEDINTITLARLHRDVELLTEDVSFMDKVFSTPLFDQFFGPKAKL